MINIQTPDIKYGMLSRVELKFLKLFSTPEENQKIKKMLNKKECDE